MYKTSPIYWPILLAFDGLGSILFFPKKLAKEPNIVRKVLVLRIEELGDIILALPMLHALRDRYKGASITVLCKADYAGFMERQGFKAIATESWIDGSLGLSGFIALALRLRRQGYDLCIETHADPRSNLLAGFSAKYSIGFGFRGGGFFLNRTAPYRQVHISALLLKLAGQNAGRKIRLELSSHDRAMAKRLLAGLRHPIICLHPGTRRKGKEWPVDHWKSLIGKLRGNSIVVTGTANEKALVYSICSGSSARNLAGKTDLFCLAALLEKCDLLIAPDSGPVHIARVQGTPLISLVGDEDIALWGYNEDKYRSLQSPTRKPRDIAVDEVHRLAIRLLDR